MPGSLAAIFAPKYTVLNKCDEDAQGFAVHTVTWEGQAQVKVSEQANGHSFKVGFIQVVKAYDIKADYRDSIVQWKLPSTPMCDTDPATDAPWYEASAVPVGAGVSPELTSPVNKIVIPKMLDRPSVKFLWEDGNGNPILQFRRKQSFQTWLVVKEKAGGGQPTYTPLYCFAYSIDQLVRVDATKPVGQRCKVEVGGSTQAQYPTTYSMPPFPKIPAQAFVQACPNTSQTYSRTVRTHA